MDLNEYQFAASKTAGKVSISNDTFLYPAIGIANEAGELLGKIKKIFRDDAGVVTDTKKQEIAGELGDILWYVSETARQFGFSLHDIAAQNIQKLASRAERGTIHGSGDTR